MDKKVNNYIDHIDGLRGYSIMLVTLFHLHFKYFDYGYLGVDIFFVISGYLITQSLESSTCESFYRSYFSFINKRLKRILPCSCVVLYFYLIYKIHENSSNPVIFNDIYYSSMFLSNEYFISIKQDYFSNIHPSSILNYWSLSVEFQYYVIYPFIFYIINKTSVYLMIILILLSFIYGFKLMFNNNDIVVYYSLLYRMFELNIGGLLKLIKYENNLNEYLLSIIFIICPFIFHFANDLFFINKNKVVADEIMLLCMIIICLLIISHKEMKNIVVNNVIIKYFGKCSYIIYLIHYPLIQLLPINNKYLKIIIVLILSTLLYELYDKRIQKLKISNIQIMLMNILFFLIPLLNSYICYIKYDYFHNKLLNYNPDLSYSVDNETSNYFSSIISKKDDYIDRVIPLELHNFDKPINYSKIYNSDPYMLFAYFGDIVCDLCVEYPKNYDPKQAILVIGDSYAVQWLWIIRKYAYVRNLTLRYIICMNSDIFGKCRINSYYHIIIPIFSSCRFITKNIYNQFIDKYKELVFQCNKNSDIIISFTNHPVPKMDKKDCKCSECISRRLPRCYTIIGINRTYSNFPPMMDIPNYHIINVTDELCVNGICSCVIDDYLVYDYVYHINPAILMKFYPKVERELDRILKNEYQIVREYNASDKCSLIMMGSTTSFCKRAILPSKSITRDFNDYFYENFNKSDYDWLLSEYGLILDNTS